MTKPVICLLIFSGLVFFVVASGLALAFVHLRQAARQYDLNEQLDNAAMTGDNRRVTALLAAGANASYQGNDFTPLTCAIQYGHTETAQILLAGGADVNKGRWSGYTPLMAAVAAGNVEMVKRLLSRGAAVNGKDNNGTTALKEAIEKKDSRLIALLRQAGAKD